MNWNTRDLLRQCLKLLAVSSAGVDCEVIVVDNGSNDGSAQMVSDEFPDYTLIKNEENLGFAAANNQGIRESHGTYIALVNSDTMVSPGALATMTNYLIDNPDVGGVGCTLVDGGGRRQYSGGFVPSVMIAISQVFFLPNIFRGKVPGVFVSCLNRSEPTRVEWICAACMVVRRQAADEAGLLNEDYFMYAEDMEWGLRIHAHGWQMKILPWVEVTHYGGASNAAPDEFQTLWLDGVDKVAKCYQKPARHMVFGLILSLSFALRSLGMFLLWLMAMRPKGPVGEANDLRKRARALRHYSKYLARLVLSPGNNG